METLSAVSVLLPGLVEEPESETVKSMEELPLALAMVVYVRAAKSAALRVVLVVTTVVPSALKRLMKVGMDVMV